METRGCCAGDSSSLGGDFGAARPRLTLSLLLPTPVAAVAQQRRAGNDPMLRNCLLNPPGSIGKSSC